MSNITGSSIYIKEEGASGSWFFKVDNVLTYTKCNFPISIFNGNTATTCMVQFETDLTVTSGNHFFDLKTQKIRIEGNNKKIKALQITTSFSVKGLFNNYFLIYGVEQGHNDIEIKDLEYFNPGNLTLSEGHGYFTQPSFGINVLRNKFSNLINNGNINNNYCSGIFGNSSFRSSQIEVKKCINRGTVGGNNYCGGIFGPNSLRNNLSSTFTTSENYDSLIEDCINYGAINAVHSGGIFGRYCLKPFFYTCIKKCINFGDINGTNSGGICGYLTGGLVNYYKPNDDDILLEFTCCYNYGKINNLQSSGLLADFSNFYQTKKNIIFKISACYNYGQFSSQNSHERVAGIMSLNYVWDTAPLANKSKLIIENSYNVADLSVNNKAGGIISHLHTYDVRNSVEIKNCYSVTPGNTTNGIIYSSSHYTNWIVQDNNVTSTWDDTVAENTLLNFATANNNFNNYNIDNVDWIQVSPGVPYVLACFNQSIYENTYANKLPGDIIDPSTPPPMATYSLVGKNSNFINFDANDKTITISNDAPSGTFKVIIHQLANNTYNTMLVSINIIAICFGENTLLPIITENNQVKYNRIKDIKIGDVIMTEYHGPKKIKYIYHKKIQNVSNYQNKKKNKDKLYVLKKQDYPELIEDLVLTGGHPILVNLNFSCSEMLKKPDMFLRNFYRLETYKNKKSVDFDCDGVYNIYNVILENNNKYNKYPIRINGILTESCEEYLYNKLYKIMK